MISDHDFGSTNVYDDGKDDSFVGFNLYCFDIRFQKKLEAAQPIEVDFKFSEDVLDGINGYALILTNKWVS